MTPRRAAMLGLAPGPPPHRRAQSRSRALQPRTSKLRGVRDRWPTASRVLRSALVCACRSPPEGCVLKAKRVTELHSRVRGQRAEAAALVLVGQILIENQKYLAPCLRDPMQPAINAAQIRPVVVLPQV